MDEAWHYVQIPNDELFHQFLHGRYAVSVLKLPVWQCGYFVISALHAELSPSVDPWHLKEFILITG